MRKYLLSAISAFILLSSCQQKTKPQFSSTLENFKFLDSLKQYQITYLWSNNHGFIDTSIIKDSAQTIVDRIDTIYMGDKKIYAVQTETRAPDAVYHAVGALCFIYFFDDSNQSLKKFIKKSLLYDESPLPGSWGRFPKTTLYTIGEKKYAYLLEEGFTGQGETVENLMFFEITDSLKLPKILDFGETANDNSGNCSDTDTIMSKCFSYQTSFRLIPGNTSYYQIFAHKTGTNEVEDKIRNIDSTFYYQYKNGKYELDKTIVNEENTGSK